jgi:hypothetical protein
VPLAPLATFCTLCCTPQVAVDIVHHKTMLELHQKVAPQQVIVGW